MGSNNQDPMFEVKLSKNQWTYQWQLMLIDLKRISIKIVPRK